MQLFHIKNSKLFYITFQPYNLNSAYFSTFVLLFLHISSSQVFRDYAMPIHYFETVFSPKLSCYVILRLLTQMFKICVNWKKCWKFMLLIYLVGWAPLQTMAIWRFLIWKKTILQGLWIIRENSRKSSHVSQNIEANQNLF